MKSKAKMRKAKVSQRRKSERQKQKKFRPTEVIIEELEAILDRTKDLLNGQDHTQLTAAISTLAFLTQRVFNSDWLL